MARKNQKPHISIHRAVKAHLLWCQAANYSQHTIKDYTNTFNQFIRWLETAVGDIYFHEIEPEHIEAFLRYMRETPFGYSGITAVYNAPQKHRSAKTLRNYHIALSSLWRWASEKGYVETHILQDVKAPKVHRKPINPLTEAEMVALIRHCNHPRDKAMVYTFLETLSRVAEVVEMTIGDVTFENTGGKIHIRKGKGDKGRFVHFGRRCANAIQEWLIWRDYELGDPLFCNISRNAGLPMTRQSINKHIKRLAKRAGIQTLVGPHRLRTTGACVMVKNGISTWELKRIMGHSSIETTMRYVSAANIDLHEAIKKASPLDNVRL